MGNSNNTGFRGDVRGKTIIVTGANTGIGFETAAELARFGGHVIMACRDSQRASSAKKAIVERLKGQGIEDVEARLVVEELDLASFDSIRAFATRMESLHRLDVLINNAGVSMPERKLTKEGLEITMATNHFGHFLLTLLLLPQLKKSAPSRIVVLSSLAHKWGELKFDDLNYERSFGSMQSYADSKLANVLFTRELARRLKGTGVIVNAVHPGAVATELGRHAPGYLQPLIKLLHFFFKSPLEGAQTSLYVAASQEPEYLQSGLYFADCHVVEESAMARDDEIAKKLWEVSERITQIKFPEHQENEA